MKVQQLRDGLRGNLWGVAGKNDYVIVVRQSLTGDHQSMACTALFGLHNEINSSVADCSANPFRLMTDDGEYIARRHDRRSRRNHMGQQTFAASFMQHFRKL